MKKKFISRFMLAMLTVISGIAFTACGSDEPDPNPGKPDIPEKVISGYRVQYSVTLAANMCEVAEVALAYTSDSFDESKKNHAILTPENSKVVMDYPASGQGKEVAGSVEIFPKEGFTPDPEASYAVGAKILIDVWTMYDNGENVHTSTVLPQGQSLTIKGDRVEDYISSYANKPLCSQSFKLP